MEQQRERQKTNRFSKQHNNFAHAVHFFVHFFAVFARLRRENAQFRVLRRTEIGNDKILFFFLNLDMVPRNSTPVGPAYIWQSKWVGIIAIQTKRAQIDFLSDVLVAVASLDLKLPNVKDNEFGKETRENRRTQLFQL